MLGRNLWLAMLLFLFFVPTALQAQERIHGKWWWDNAMAAQLKLTDTERKNLDEKYTESRLRLVDLKSDVEKERIKLDMLLGRQDATKEQITAGYEGLEKARANLAKERFSLLIDMRDIIGVERFQELQAMHRDRSRDRDMSRDRDRDKKKKRFWFWN
jgi:Spy/CpxP family protein refolding chaperone